MLRITILSLFLGAALLVVAVVAFFPPSNAAHQQAPAVTWNAAKAVVIAGTPALTDHRLQLQLNSTGQGLVMLGTGVIEARDFSFLHLALDESDKDFTVAIEWFHTSDPENIQSYEIESEARASLWLATDELREWSGEIDGLSLRFSGQPDDVITIDSFSILPASAIYQLRAIYSDLTAHAHWNTAAMNTYTGVFNASSFYPVVLAVALLTCSLIAYGFLLLLWRKRLSFDATVIAMLFFACWILLDALWQKRLLHQLVDTHQQFAGKSTEEKLAAGPDADLYNFVSAAKPLLESPDARVFISSKDIYFGLRTAYYFYPFNVYWPDHPLSFPPKKALKKGDYIVLIHPSRPRFDEDKSRVIVPKRHKFNAELVFANRVGTMVRVK